MFRFDMWGSDTPMLYLNITHELCAFVPFKHTMDIYVKCQGGTHWGYNDGYNPPPTDDEFPPETRRIRDWEWFIKLDDGYSHMTQISCCHRTIHGNKFEITTKKNYRRQGMFNPHLDVSYDVQNPEAYREALNHIMETARSENLRRTEEVDVSLNGTISLYRMDRYSYSHKTTLRVNQPFFALLDENVRRFVEEHPEGRDTETTELEEL
ncbi:hypothetical protein ENVG_00393 [Emiliania huxleyi virus 84]|nr:hypothetical protein ENVG_00393 [Emiliania huxleyi virus 84]